MYLYSLLRKEIDKLGIHEFMHGVVIEGSYEWKSNKQMNKISILE